ncbi:hypothetical protein FQN52_002695 [Onygenales sp. PD_12]|nr:hypothetical protein FQN52_002695 [Onygenales sp. PD_12]
MSTNPPILLTGSCVCKHIQYTSTSLPLSMSHCLCTTCRKSSGGPFQTYARFPSSAITWLNNRTPKYFRSSSFAQRAFCDQCGSSLVFAVDGREGVISLAAGSIDDRDVKLEAGEELVKADRYYWVRECPVWYGVPEDELVKHETDPDLDGPVDTGKAAE